MDLKIILFFKIGFKQNRKYILCQGGLNMSVNSKIIDEKQLEFEKFIECILFAWVELIRCFRPAGRKLGLKSSGIFFWQKTEIF